MPKPKQVNVLFAGVGGQGIVLASKLVAQMLLNQGAEVRTAETIGMAQRGERSSLICEQVGAKGVPLRR